MLRTIPWLLLTAGLAAGQEATVQMAEPFRAEYRDQDATGDHVIALWQFNAGAEAADSSGNGHTLTLRGAVFSPNGRFGGALESFPGWPVVDQAHQAQAKNDPRLTPKGAFTIELAVCAKPELEGYPESFLVDKRYVEKTDYQLILTGADRAGRRRLQMHLGFGDAVELYQSDPFPVTVGQWLHLAFVYDGAGGGRFLVDGVPAGQETKAGRQSIVAGTRPLSIGDRLGSYFHGFPGYIDDVRISSGAREFRAVGVEVTSARSVFQRREAGASVTLTVTNRNRVAIDGGRLTARLGNAAAQVHALPQLTAGASTVIDCPVDTALRPDAYTLSLTVELPTDPPFVSRERVPVTIVARPLPDRMPILMWGGNLNDQERLAAAGFTHFMGVPVDFQRIWDAGGPTDAIAPERLPAVYAQLDEALARGMRVVPNISPGRWARKFDEYRRVGRDGQHNGEDVCALEPRVQAFCYDVGASLARSYGGHPALGSVLIHTEIRGESRPSWNAVDQAAWRAVSGTDIPELAVHQRGVAYGSLDGFPADRVVPEDHPLLAYYRWWWSEGDGWNQLHTKVHEGLATAGRDDVWTFYDPAVRVASQYGSGGGVDYISQWTYSYPDPLRIGLATDELFRMAAGSSRPDQQVMKMTQVIWYRNQTAPEPGEEVRQQGVGHDDQDIAPQGTGTVDASGRYQAEWERRIPDARFITIAPMHLREALWTKLSRPIQGIMYHGWQSLVDCEASHASYRYTHPATQHELRRLVDTVVEPLGPTLRRVPDRPADVALLQSFASQMFTRGGTYGWNGGWIGDMFLILNYAQLQSEVVYDQTILDEGLDRFKVLVMPDCQVLSAGVVERIKAWQAAGGLIVGDQNLCPALTSDLLVTAETRSKNAAEARQSLQAKAAELRRELDPHYQRYADSSNPDVVTRVRQAGSGDYVFAINDNREFGNYVGHHELAMEDGLPSSTQIRVDRAAGHVYDLRRSRAVAVTAAGGQLSWPADLAPCDGALWLITSQPVAALALAAPAEAAPGSQVTVNLTVADPAGQPVDAVIPVRLALVDPAGEEAEYSGYHAAVGGQLAVTFDLAVNDRVGLWRVQARELAAGNEADAYLRVK